MRDGYPTAETTQKLDAQLDLMRATQAYLGFKPAMTLQPVGTDAQREHHAAVTEARAAIDAQFETGGNQAMARLAVLVAAVLAAAGDNSIRTS